MSRRMRGSAQKFAIALAVRVLPQPCTPRSRSPLGGGSPNFRAGSPKALERSESHRLRLSSPPTVSRSTSALTNSSRPLLRITCRFSSSTSLMSCPFKTPSLAMAFAQAFSASLEGSLGDVEGGKRLRSTQAAQAPRDRPGEEHLAVLCREVLEDGLDALLFPGDEIEERIAGADERVEIADEAWLRGGIGLERFVGGHGASLQRPDAPGRKPVSPAAVDGPPHSRHRLGDRAGRYVEVRDQTDPLLAALRVEEDAFGAPRLGEG